MFYDGGYDEEARHWMEVTADKGSEAEAMKAMDLLGMMMYEGEDDGEEKSEAFPLFASVVIPVLHCGATLFGHLLQ
jgi:TPR repeat protein